MGRERRTRHPSPPRASTGSGSGWRPAARPSGVALDRVVPVARGRGTARHAAQPQPRLAGAEGRAGQDRAGQGSAGGPAACRRPTPRQRRMKGRLSPSRAPAPALPAMCSMPSCGHAPSGACRSAPRVSSCVARVHRRAPSRRPAAAAAAAATAPAASALPTACTAICSIPLHCTQWRRRRPPCRAAPLGTRAPSTRVHGHAAQPPLHAPLPSVSNRSKASRISCFCSSVSSNFFLSTALAAGLRYADCGGGDGGGAREGVPPRGRPCACPAAGSGARAPAPAASSTRMHVHRALTIPVCREGGRGGGGSLRAPVVRVVGLSRGRLHRARRAHFAHPCAAARRVARPPASGGACWCMTRAVARRQRRGAPEQAARSALAGHAPAPPRRRARGGRPARPRLTREGGAEPAGTACGVRTATCPQPRRRGRA